MQSHDEEEVINKRILIVEDSEIQALVLKKILVKHGYEVIEARNGAEGISMARTHRAALIVSDILMPVMDGYRMTRELKNDPALRDIPVILLTQLADIEEVISGLDCGAETYVIKPYDEGFLMSRVESVLKNTCRFKNNSEEKVTEFEYAGKNFSIRSGRGQTISFLLSTYENAIIKNKELVKAQEELQTLNEQLKKTVSERAGELSAEVIERKQAEKALRASEERFRVVIESASDAVICLEPPGRIYLWNGKAEEMFGYKASEAIGMLFHDIVIPERYREAAKKGLEVFFQSGAGRIIGKTIEMEALRKDGAEFTVELSVSAVNLHGVWNSIGIIRDVSERKRLEKELRENLEDVERMNKLMVGRELKMEELRERIKELEAKVKAQEDGKAK